MAPQGGAGRAAQGPAGDGAGVGLDRRERRFPDRRGAPALLARHHRPELLTHVVGPLQGREAASGDRVDLLLARAHVVEGLVPLDLELEAPVAGEPGPPPVGVEGAPGDGWVRLGAPHRSRGGGVERLGQPAGHRRRAGRARIRGVAGLGVDVVWVRSVLVVHSGLRSCGGACGRRRGRRRRAGRRVDRRPGRSMANPPGSERCPVGPARPPSPPPATPPAPDGWRRFCAESAPSNPSARVGAGGGGVGSGAAGRHLAGRARSGRRRDGGMAGGRTAPRRRPRRVLGARKKARRTGNAGPGWEPAKSGALGAIRTPAHASGGRCSIP